MLWGKPRCLLPRQRKNALERADARWFRKQSSRDADRHAAPHVFRGCRAQANRLLLRAQRRPASHSLTPAAALRRAAEQIDARRRLRSPCYVCKQKHPAGLSRLQAKVTFNADCGLVCHGWIALCAFVLGFGGKARTHSSPHSESIRDRTRSACRGKIDAAWTVGTTTRHNGHSAPPTGFVVQLRAALAGLPTWDRIRFVGGAFLPNPARARPRAQLRLAEPASPAYRPCLSPTQAAVLLSTARNGCGSTSEP